MSVYVVNPVAFVLIRSCTDTSLVEYSPFLEYPNNHSTINGRWQTIATPNGNKYLEYKGNIPPKEMKAATWKEEVSFEFYQLV